jgi:hypothetical protein
MGVVRARWFRTFDLTLVLYNVHLTLTPIPLSVITTPRFQSGVMLTGARAVGAEPALNETGVSVG